MLFPNPGLVSNRTLSLQAQALSILRTFGSNAHVYLPGIGTVSGLTAGNYLDSNGSTGFAAVDGLVGLELDAAGSVGPELVTNGGFDSGATGWVFSGAAYWAIGSGVATSTSPDTAIAYLDNTQSYAAIVTGSTYQVEFDWTGGGGTAYIRGGSGFTFTGTGRKSFYYVAGTSTAGYGFRILTNTSGTFTADNISVREVTGTHATSTGAARPTLRRGAVNLLTYSNDLSNAAWSTGGATTISGSQVSPTGYTDAYKVIGAGASCYKFRSVAFVTGTAYCFSVYVKPIGQTAVTLASFTQSGTANFTLTGAGSVGALSGIASAPTITLVDNGYYRISAVFTASATASNNIGLSGGTFTGEAFSQWGAQLEVGSTASDYSPTTTAAASNPNAGRYSWQFAGAQSMALGSVPFQTQDDFFIVGACNQTSVSAALFSVATNTTGELITLANAAGKAQVYMASGGTTVQFAATNPSLTGVTVVLSALKVGSTLVGRQNGSQFGTTSTALVPASAFTTSTIGAYYLGAGLLNGSLGPIIFGKGTLTAAQLLVLERFVSSLTPNGPTF